MTSRGADERGSMLPLFAGLVLVSFVMVALVTELALLGATYRATASAADAAAETAASMVERDALYTDEIRVDADAAERVARERIAATVGSAEVEVIVSAARVCVHVDRPHDVRTLGAIGIELATVSASACAIPASG